MSSFNFSLYGLKIQSDFDFKFPYVQLEEHSEDLTLKHVSLGHLQTQLQNNLLKKDESRWYHYSELKDGAIHLVWPDHFEFLVHREKALIEFALYPGIPQDSLAVYLLAQALSFSLIHRSKEPLHGAVLEYQNKAFSILGDSGAGKSCLTASLLQKGCKLVSDDVLLADFENTNQPIAQAGCPHIKMFPKDAEQFLPEFSSGAAMNQLTSKLIIDLPTDKVFSHPLPLTTLFILRRTEGHELNLHEMSSNQVLPLLMANSFNTLIQTPERLKRQFSFFGKLIESIKTYVIDYPHERVHQTSVCDFILSNMSHK